ncbi:MAG: carbon storage regulator [Lachnospiraceae bacterium]|nr:carbon storage regulator [Lachnospiraceae bacterium]
MLRLTVSAEEYLMIGDDIKIVFLGGSKNHLRIMVDAPREVDVVRSRVIENKITDEVLRATLPKYYAEPEIPEKYRKNKHIIITGDNRKTARKPHDMRTAEQNAVQKG